jgi:hypothetical protein
MSTAPQAARGGIYADRDGNWIAPEAEQAYWEQHPDEYRQHLVESGQPLADLSRLMVVHVDNSSADGQAVERAQAEMRRLHEAGWSVAPVPADGQEHPYGEPCPVCTTGPFWDTEALTRDFEVIGFAAPFVVVKRRSDGVRGSLEFTHRPRVYFGWKEG